jgi:hypothetical protein
MSAIEQFFGGQRAPKSIVNAFNMAGATPVSMTGASQTKQTLTGAVTAGVLKTMLSLTGQGAVNILALATVNGTSRTLRMKITIDGVVVFDPGVSAAVVAAGRGIIPVGGISESSVAFTLNSSVLQNVYFNSSLLVEIASSLTETDFTTFHANYVTY